VPIWKVERWIFSVMGRTFWLSVNRSLRKSTADLSTHHPKLKDTLDQDDASGVGVGQGA
jgi:hypothetical protein